jgi:hypothetical protein
MIHVNAVIFIFLSLYGVKAFNFVNQKNKLIIKEFMFLIRNTGKELLFNPGYILLK